MLMTILSNTKPRISFTSRPPTLSKMAFQWQGATEVSASSGMPGIHKVKSLAESFSRLNRSGTAQTLRSAPKSDSVCALSCPSRQAARKTSKSRCT